VPLAKLATKIMTGMTLDELKFTKQIRPGYFSVKEAVFPFLKFPGIDTLLGPEMLSTGEVMGIDDDFGIAFAKSQIAAGNSLPTSGNVLFSIKDGDKKKAVELARKMYEMGFRIVATKKTCLEFINNNIPSEFILKMSEGRPNVVDWIINGKIDLIINTTTGAQSIRDSFSIRRTALDKQIPYVTTIRATAAVVKAIEAMNGRKIGVKPVQHFYPP